MRLRTTMALVLAAAALAGAAEAGAQTKQASASRPSAEGVVNINTATAQQLAFLPGIGPSRAQAIVRARQSRPFRNVQELQRVRGIGRSTLRSLRPYLTVSGETTLRRPVASTKTRSQR